MDIFKRENTFFLDDNMSGKEVNGIKVIGKVQNLIEDDRNIYAIEKYKILIAFGSLFMKEREVVFRRLKDKGFLFFNVIHQNTVIDKTSVVGEGNIISSFCVIHPNSKIGNNCVFCTSCTIDHDCVVEHHVYLSPGVNLSGGAKVKKGAFIGTNATIIPLKTIGEYAIVGAGAVVIDDVPDYATVVGNPARIIKKGDTL
jgi:acetyltransferase EpsM